MRNCIRVTPKAGASVWLVVARDIYRFRSNAISERTNHARFHFGPGRGLDGGSRTGRQDNPHRN
jgi:hypothetical protein